MQLVCLGYTTETDVCHASGLETMALLICSGAFMGSLALSLDAPEVKMFNEACDFVFHEMRGYESVICSSVIALEGQFGDFHQTRRTIGSKLCINPLMPFYWAFDVEKVARSILYLNDILDTEKLSEVGSKIKEFGDLTPRRRIPASPFEFEESSETGQSKLTRFDHLQQISRRPALLLDNSQLRSALPRECCLIAVKLNELRGQLKLSC
ncbi:MAG: hypothetical protein K2X93_00495 [Candidatus Obscuribacterales bacterium]|nr:hypothetical protein [Candidatus Obscuribacterales bacterium]